MCFLIEPVYYMTWIWTLHRAHNKLKSPIEEDNIWATSRPVPRAVRPEVFSNLICPEGLVHNCFRIPLQNVFYSIKLNFVTFMP